ncbi:MAG: glycoside hydrolase N-terminal domain-containing protein [Marinoscillum sp.]
MIFRFSVLTLFVVLSSCKTPSDDSSLQLWYDEPAVEWTEALPIGNGRIGAMVFAGVEKEHIQFNEETLWTGKPRNYNREGAAQYLAEIRQLLFEGNQKEAEELAGKVFMGLQSNEANYATQMSEWLANVNAPSEMVYSTLEYDDSDWKSMPVGAVDGWESQGFIGMDGAVWMRFTFELPAEWSGKDLVLNLGRIMDEDVTYVNGSEVGSETNPYTHRRYDVPSSAFQPGKNVLAVHVLDYYDKGGMVGFKTGEPMVVYPKGGDFSVGIDISTPWKYFPQNTNPPDYPQYMAAYQPFGDLWLDFENHENATNYKRSLDISTAVATTTYDIGEVSYTREYFVSAPDQAMVMKIKSSGSGMLTFTANMTAIHEEWSQSALDNNTLQLKVQVKNGALNGVADCKVVSKGGAIEINDKGLSVNGADEVTIALTAATNFVDYDDVSGQPASLAASDLEKLNLSAYEQVKSRHIADYQQYFDRFAIDLGGDQSDTLTTDQRIEAFAETQDPALVALYVQYGRYLLISSSRPGTQPANLQGIWNDDLTPPWDSKYTTNINLEMNYWPAEVLNLSEMHEPLFTMIEEIAERGEQTARFHYNADGWVLHHNTDLWRGTAPINHANHGIWVTGGAWLCHHLWEHFEYTRDTVFLKERAYPLMKGAAEFFVDYLVEDPNSGKLISGPSNSPETGGLVMGPTMDHQIIRDLFKNTIATAGILGVDDSFVDTLSSYFPRIAENQIGQYGQLQEWMEDKDDPENKHRHVSHLWGLYPGNEINVNTPDLLEAAKQSLLFRGDDGTGWSLAWKINLWARFRDGDHAWKMINNLFRPAWSEEKRDGGSYKNLFDAHPPFQIDGNFGAAAGVAEMLVQTQGDTIVLLPALPSALPEGKVSGLKVKGGVELDLVWENGELVDVQVVNSVKGDPILIYRGQVFNNSKY